MTRQGASVSHHRKKDAAVARAMKSARKEGEAQVIIKKKDGKIQDERTYGSDPHPPRG